MATRKIKVQGWNHEAGTSCTVTIDGAEVHNGALTTAVVPAYDGSNDPAAGEIHHILTWEYTNADDTLETDHALVITCTSGSMTIGNILVNAGNDAAATYPFEDDGWSGDPCIQQVDSDWYYNPGADTGTYGHGEDGDMGERTNILINGSAPGLLLTADADNGIGEPEGGKDTPTYGTWEFQLDNGDVFACNLRVPALLADYVAP